MARGGLAKIYLKKILYVNIVNFTKVDEGGGEGNAYLPKVDNFPFFVEPLPCTFDEESFCNNFQFK